MKLFSEDVALALADDAFIFTTESAAAPLVIPACLAIDAGSGRVVALGEEAKPMMGRNPENIHAHKVLVAGSPVSLDLATALIRAGLKQIAPGALSRPRMVVASRWDGPARDLLKQATLMAGAREVHLLEFGMATAIGMGLEVQNAAMQPVLSVCDDWFHFCVTSLSGLITAISGDIGADAFVEDIQNHLSITRGIRPVAEQVKAELFSQGFQPGATMSFAGWEVWAGRSETGRVTTSAASGEEFGIGLTPSLVRLAERVKSALRALPNESQFQITQTPLHATGSAMKIPGLAEALARQLGMQVIPHATPVDPAIEGTKRALGEIRFLRSVSTQPRSPR